MNQRKWGTWSVVLVLYCTEGGFARGWQVCSILQTPEQYAAELQESLETRGRGKGVRLQRSPGILGFETVSVDVLDEGLTRGEARALVLEMRTRRQTHLPAGCQEVDDLHQASPTVTNKEGCELGLGYLLDQTRRMMLAGYEGAIAHVAAEHGVALAVLGPAINVVRKAQPILNGEFQLSNYVCRSLEAEGKIGTDLLAALPMPARAALYAAFAPYIDSIPGQLDTADQFNIHDDAIPAIIRAVRENLEAVWV